MRGLYNPYCYQKGYCGDEKALSLPFFPAAVCFRRGFLSFTPHPGQGAGLTGSETDPIGLATDSVTLEGGAAPGVWIQSGSHTIDALSDSGTLSVSGSPGISVTGDGSLLMVNSAGSLSL